MDDFIPIKFYFRGNSHHCIIRRRDKGDHTEYAITTINGDLERLLFDHHIIKEVNGLLQIDLPSQNPNLARLKCAITYGLSEYLKSDEKRLLVKGER